MRAFGVCNENVTLPPHYAVNTLRFPLVSAHTVIEPPLGFGVQSIVVNHLAVGADPPGRDSARCCAPMRSVAEGQPT